jgi:DNA-directed RNA polymerase subunit beta'
LRDYGRVLDKKGIKELTELLAQEGDPELYRKVIHALHSVGSSASQSTGASFSIYDLRTPPRTKEAIRKLRAEVQTIVEGPDGTREDEKEQAIINLVSSRTPAIEKLMYEEALAAENPFAIQVLSGSRGGKGDLRSLLVGDMLVMDHRDRTIGAPIMHSYSAGVDPEEYWAGAYGARKGVVSTKFATAEAGFFGKRMVQAAHQQVVTERDCETDRGIPVPSNDPDNVGSVLAATSGNFRAGTVVDPRVQRQLRRKEIVVRSPLTCEAKRGVCAKCVGVRERGDFPEVGDNVGVAAAQSLTEQLSQSMLGAKHRTRVDPTKARKSLEGFDLVDQLVEVPKAFREAAAVAKLDGTVKSVIDAPQGGKFITVGDETHYVPEDFKVHVKSGDRVEAGDVMSEGVPNPLDLVKHRGIGAGRLEFVNLFRNAYKEQGLHANRRNIELMARGLINHVRVTELDGPNDSLPDDVLEYTSIERDYRPRYGFRTGAPKMATGQFLERPALHYSIGTRVTKSVARNLDRAGIKNVTFHRDPPPFEPQMIRSMETLTRSPDWQIRLGGSLLQKGLLESLHRGRASEITGVSYMPGLARGKGFGERLKTEGVY